MDSNAILRIDRLSVRYGKFTAVDSLDLALRQGELLGLLGPNGAGKSSILRVLTGQCKPAVGSASVAGLDVVRNWQAVKPLFGYVPDRDNHFEEMSGRRNLLIFAGLYGAPASRVGDCLELVELGEAADLPVRAYSLGMRRKLLLVRSLLHRPQLLYLDEPGANLDAHSVTVIHRVLKQLTADGVTVLLTTHNMTEVEQICDRVAILCRGRLVALDSPGNLQRQHCERKVDVVRTSGEREEFDLACIQERDRLGRAVLDGSVASLQTRRFDFREAFLKLTGTAFE